MLKKSTQLRDDALKMGPTHFIGIGGIGVSGIAETILKLGYRASGSDVRPYVAASGTHCKTTTTALVTSLLEAGGLDLMVVN